MGFRPPLWLPGAIHWNAFIILGGGFFKQTCKGVGNHLSGTWSLLNNLVWWSSQCCPPNGQTGHPLQQLFLGHFISKPMWNSWNIIPVCIIWNLDSTDSLLQCFKCLLTIDRYNPWATHGCAFTFLNGTTSYTRNVKFGLADSDLV
jgi:hypothetical protein